MTAIYKCRMCGEITTIEHDEKIYQMENRLSAKDYPDPVTRATMVLSPEARDRHGRWHRCKDGSLGRCDHLGFKDVK